MEEYVTKLIMDIDHSAANVKWPEQKTYYDFLISDKKEEATAPLRSLEEWTGIYKDLLPEEALLSDQQVNSLLESLIRLLNVYNCCFVLQVEVPDRIQYRCIRENFKQIVKVKRYNTGFFQFCEPGTEHHTCVLKEYCQCGFYAALHDRYEDDDEEISSEEEKSMLLKLVKKHLMEKYGNNWRKYYQYFADNDQEEINSIIPLESGNGDSNEESDADKISDS